MKKSYFKNGVWIGSDEEFINRFTGETIPVKNILELFLKLAKEPKNLPEFNFLDGKFEIKRESFDVTFHQICSVLNLGVIKGLSFCLGNPDELEEYYQNLQELTKIR